MSARPVMASGRYDLVLFQNVGSLGAPLAVMVEILPLQRAVKTPMTATTVSRHCIVTQEIPCPELASGSSAVSEP